MKFVINKNIYSEAVSEKNFKKLLRRVALKRPVKGLYVITLPLMNHGLMEIYDYNELLQPYYRKKKEKINILGISASKEGAKQLVADILEDVYNKMGSADINKYFGLGTGN